MQRHTHSFLRKIAVALTLAAVTMLGATAQAADINWVTTQDPGNWFTPSHWQEGTVPVAGQSVGFGGNDPVNNVNIDNGGNDVNQPADTLFVDSKVIFEDLNPGTVDALIFNTIQFNGSGGGNVQVDVPVIANTVTSNRHGATFNAPVDIGSINSQGSHQQNWNINATPSDAFNSIRIADGDGRGGSHDDNFRVNADAATLALDLEWGRLTVDFGVTFDAGAFQMTDDVDWSTKNQIILNGDMVADSFAMELIDAGNNVSVVDQGTGTWGAIGNGSVDNQVSWITGDGILTVGTPIPAPAALPAGLTLIALAGLRRRSTKLTTGRRA